MSTPFSIQFPAALDDARSLGIAANDAGGALASPGLAIGGGSFTLPLADANEFGESGAISIESEIVYFTRSGATFTVTQRGAEGTVEANHAAGVTAECAVTAGYHAAHSAAIQAIEAKIGIGASTPVAGAFLVGGGTAGSSSWRAIVANDLPDLSATYAVVGHNHAGVYQPLDQDLTDIAALTANGLLRRTGGVWGMDATAYLTANQTITLSGDASGSGATSIAVTLATVNASPGSFGATSKTVTATVNSKGLVTALSEQNIAIAASQVASGTFGVARGGTGLSTIASGKLLYASALDTLAELTLAATFTISTATLDIATGGITNAMLAGSIANAKLANSSITIAGSATSLGGSITASAILDSLGSTQGQILYRGASGWVVLGPGTAGQVLQTGGAAANPSWTNASGGSGANPTASVGLTAVNGVASTFMRSDAAPALSQSITPTWTGQHIWQVSNAAAVSIGPNGDTNPTLRIVTNVASAATGLSITGNAAGSGVTLTALSSGAGESILFLAKSGSNTVLWGNTANSTRGSLVADANQAYVSTGSTTSLSFSTNNDFGIFTIFDTSKNLIGRAGSAFGWTSSTSNSNNSSDTLIRRAVAAVISVEGASSVGGAIASPARTPSQITANQNDYAPGSGLFQRWSSDASRNVTGMAAGQAGEFRFVWNVGSFNIVLQNENAGSTAANRFTTTTGADLTLAAGGCAIAQYDATSSRWRVGLL